MMDYKVPHQAVNADEFRELATSRRNLRRADDEGIRGLLDIDCGIRYVIDEQLLFATKVRTWADLGHYEAS